MFPEFLFLFAPVENRIRIKIIHETIESSRHDLRTHEYIFVRAETVDRPTR